MKGHTYMYEKGARRGFLPVIGHTCMRRGGEGFSL